MSANTTAIRSSSLNSASSTSGSSISIHPLPSKNPSPPKPGDAPDHWVGNPPTSFKNPWPSFVENNINPWTLLGWRFARNRNFVPVPETRDELVKVRTPDWGRSQPGWEQGLKATWLGHAGFLVETGTTLEGVQAGVGEGVAAEGAAKLEKPPKRGLRILFDAVFSERTSPLTFIGPKRYTPTPCQLSDLPDIDLIVTSHDHYDHMDLNTISSIYHAQKARGGPAIHFFAGLGNARHLVGRDAGIVGKEVTECDWWDSHQVVVPGVGEIEITCTPTQHFSGRTYFDRGRALWCSWVVRDVGSGKSLFFAGDTAYRAVGAPSPCPGFKQIGEVFGGFDLAMVPIGLYSPQEFMGNVHCCPEDSLNIHKDVRSRRTIGMHYGTVRGGISGQYEDVREPPRRWREAAEKEGLWGTECGLCDVGETVSV